jgi:hypothetical protein
MVIMAVIMIIIAAVIIAPLLTMVVIAVLLPLRASSPISFFGVNIGIRCLQ